MGVHPRKSDGAPRLATQNPPWSRDELILALDVYLQHRTSPPGKTSQEIAELSGMLNRLAPQLHSEKYDRYRNVNGVYMKLMNFRRLDAEYGTGKGLQHGAQLEEVVWEEFSVDLPHCHKTAETIRQAIDDLESGAIQETSDEGITEAPEGTIVTRLHSYRERNRAIVQEKKKDALKRFGALACEVCSLDFEKAYGERGAGFIECHHEKPVTDLVPGEKTKLEDLRLVCSNCHRMIHARRPWLSVDELKALPAVEWLKNSLQSL